MAGPSVMCYLFAPLDSGLPPQKPLGGNRSVYYPRNQSLFVYYSYLFGPIGEYQHVLTCVHLECFMHFFN